MSNFNFKDNLIIESGKFLKWNDITGIYDIIGVNTSGNLKLNAPINGDIYINDNNTNTFIRSDTIISSKLAVGIFDTANINADITLAKNSYIGLNSTIGSNNGFLGLSASGSFNNLNSSRIILFGNESTTGSAGQINVYSGNVSSGHLQFYTGNDSLILQVLNSGTTNFSPDGSTIRLSVADLNTTITNPLIVTNTEQSYSGTSGAIQVSGGLGIKGNLTVEGTFSINNLTGNINFNNTMPSTSYSTGTIFISGGLGIENSTPAASFTSGGAISAAGGLALGKNAMIGGSVNIFSSDISTDAETGSLVAYGGVGINGQTNIRSNSSPQIRLTPVNTGNETSIQFGQTNNYTTSGSWKIGQNVEALGSGAFGIYSADIGMYITLNTGGIALEQSVVASQGITTTNLNFIGDLYQNGVLYTPNSSQWTGQATSGTIYYGTSGSELVGIGTSNPQATLDINGSLIALDITTGNLNFTGDLYQNGVLYTPNSSQWSGTSGSIYFAKTSGSVFVGIGTTNPISTLDINGDVSIRTTIDNALNVDGGIVINKMINLSGISTQFTGTFTSGNNILSPTPAKGLLFPTANIRSFTSVLNISTTRSTGGNIFTQYTLEGIQTENGWKISDNYIGDDLGLSFTIDNTGQVNYISNNVSNWVETTIRFQAVAYSITGNFTGITVETSGNFGVTGRLNVLNTEQAISLNMGAVVVDGGVSVAKNLILGTSLQLSGGTFEFANTVQALNNQIIPIDILELYFPNSDFRSFTVNLSCVINASTTLSSQFTIEAVQSSSGWELFKTSVGDDTGLNFSITSLGQIQYTSTNVSGWTSTFITYHAVGYTQSGYYRDIPFQTTGSLVTLDNLIILNTNDATGISSASLALSGGLGVSKNINVGGGATFGGHLIPDTNITYDLGSSTNRWRDLYLSGNTINLGGVPISTNTTGTISFGDTILSTSTDGNTGTSISNISSNIISSQNITAALISSTNLLITDASITTLTSTLVSSTNLLITDASIDNISAANISSLTGTIPTLLTTNISAASGSASIGLISSTNLLTTNISAANISVGSISIVNGTVLNNLVVTGTLTAVNITNTNLITTTISAGSGVGSIGTLVSETLISGASLSTSQLTAFGTVNTIGNIFTTGGNIGISNTAPSYSLDVVGDIYASGDIISFSDIRLKSDIITITNSTELIDNLRGVYYTNNSNGKRSIGVIAQEIQQILPEVVADQGDYLGVCYGNIVGLLIEGMKTLKKELETVKTELHQIQQLQPQITISQNTSKTKTPKKKIPKAKKKKIEEN